MIADNLEKPPAVLRILQRAAQQRLRKTLNRGKRSFQLVRHVGHEVASRTFQPPQLRNIVQNQNGAMEVISRCAHRSCIHPKNPGIHCAHLDLSRHALSARKRLLDGCHQIRLPDKFKKRAVYAESFLHADGPAKDFVAENDPLIGRDDRDPFHHAAQNGG